MLDDRADRYKATVMVLALVRATRALTRSGIRDARVPVRTRG